jgi:RimJ/RimL family protein N-acetyltransferase
VAGFVVPQRIETARLILRPFVDDDWRGLHEHYSDPECTRFTFRRPLSEAESWRALATMVGHWQLRGYGPYALEAREGGALLGTVGLWYPHDWPEPEIKWALIRRFWGQGIAAEAVLAVRAMARSALPDLRLISFIDAANAASIALAQRVGAVLEAEVEFRGGPWRIYRHPATEPALPDRTSAPIR